MPLAHEVFTTKCDIVLSRSCFRCSLDELWVNVESNCRYRPKVLHAFERELASVGSKVEDAFAVKKCSRE